MYLDRTYHPRRRHRGIGRFWPLFLLAIVGIILYEEQPSWLAPQERLPTPTPTRNAVSYQAEAEAALRSGRYEIAQRAYGQMTRLEPTNPKPLVALSELSLLFKDLPKSLDYAQKAATVAPTDVAALTARARSLNWLEKNDEAINDALDALEINPDSAATLAVLAEIYTDVGNLEIAENYIQQAMARDPQNILALRNRAYLYERQGNYEESIKTYAAAIELAPYRFDLYIELGRQYRIGMSDFTKAVEVYRRAADVYESAITLDALGDGLYNNNDNLQAVRVLRRAVTLDPNYGPAQVHLGMALYARRNFEDAAVALQKGVDLLGDQVGIEQIYLGLAYIYKEPRECDKAIPWLLKALKIDPNSRPTLEGLARCGQAP